MGIKQSLDLTHRLPQVTELTRQQIRTTQPSGMLDADFAAMFPNDFGNLFAEDLQPRPVLDSPRFKNGRR